MTFGAKNFRLEDKERTWDLILQTLVLYHLIDPGSERRLHRHWFDHSALADLLDSDFSLAEIHRLYQCHDLILEHKTALIVTPDGFPIAYEVQSGNTTDKTTLADFLAKIENQYGKADRIWIMDRGIPT